MVVVEVEQEEEENGTREIGSTVSCSAQLGSAQPHIGSPVFSRRTVPQICRVQILGYSPPDPPTPAPSPWSDSPPVPGQAAGYPAEHRVKIASNTPCPPFRSFLLIRDDRSTGFLEWCVVRDVCDVHGGE